MQYDFLKLTFIPGLKEIVLDELATYPTMQVIESSKDAIHLQPLEDYRDVLRLRSILNVYMVRRSMELNPYYISRHKSILGTLIDSVIKDHSNTFRTYKFSCAGSDTKEVRETQRYVKETYKLMSAEEADLEIYIGKSQGTWEVGVRLTARPVSLREYRVAHIAGGLNPTVAYAMNTFCNLSTKETYLNICSGSATLLIEAAISAPSLKLVGFDIDGKTNALAVQNIKKAGYLKSIHLKTADIFDTPDLGKFDVITSDLPFGMQISKGEDLEKLYLSFIDYCEAALHRDGVLVIYTSEHKTLQPVLEKSKFIITQILDLKLPTSVQVYLYPKIFVCRFK